MLSLLNIMLNVVSPMLIIVGLAVLFDRHFSPDPRLLSRLGIYLLTPCLVIDMISRTELRATEVLDIVLVAALSMTGVIVIGGGLARLFKFDRQLQSAFLLSVGLINAGNYGLPLNEFAFGQAGLERAIMFMLVSSVMTNSVGVFLASRGTASVKRSLMNILMVPVPYAIAIGFALNTTGIMLPLPLQRAVGLLAQATVPLMLVILGVQLSRTFQRSRATLKGRTGPLLLASACRLLIAPMLTAVVVFVLGVTGLTRQVCIVQSSMPTGVSSGLLATEFGSDAEFVTSSILVSTLLSIVTLPILIWLIT